MMSHEEGLSTIDSPWSSGRTLEETKHQDQRQHEEALKTVFSSRGATLGEIPQGP